MSAFTDLSSGAAPEPHFFDLSAVTGDVRFRAFWVQEVLYLEAHSVIRTTPKGAWIEVYGKERWVSNLAATAWAKPTREGAINSACVRLALRAAHLAREVRECRTSIAALRVLRPDLAMFADAAEGELE